MGHDQLYVVGCAHLDACTHASCGIDCAATSAAALLELLGLSEYGLSVSYMRFALLAARFDKKLAHLSAADALAELSLPSAREDVNLQRRKVHPV